MLCAAVHLLLAPPAVAAEKKADAKSVCPGPEAHSRYETDVFSVRVSLPVAGCAVREERRFALGIRVVRMDHHGGHDITERTATCGPYPQASAAGSDDAAHGSTCDLKLTVDHPEVENAQYDVEITYPGANGQRTMTAMLFCTSDGNRASCDR